MVRADVTSGAAFKAALRGTIVLVLVMALSGVAAFSYLDAEITREMRNQINEDRITLEDIYRIGGPTELIEAIDGLRHPLRARSRLLGLFDSKGNRMAGNFAAFDARQGWFVSSAPAADSSTSERQPPEGRFLVNSSRLNGLTLIVGLNMSALDATKSDVKAVFAAMGLVIGTCFLLIGYVASLNSMRKLRHMAEVLDRVSHGDAAARLDVSANNDQIDRVARAVNLHLDRLSVLMATTKASAAALAHDLRTPLSRAFLAVDRAQLTLSRGEDATEALEEIEAELSRLRSIFDVILRISRLDQAQYAAPLAPVAVAPLLSDLAETFSILAEDNGQTLLFEPVPEGLTLVGDAPMLSQLLANLLQNAINHCPKHTTIRLCARDTGEAVLLQVSDNGPGIPEAEHEKVFELFYSLDPNRSKGQNGLGLALVRALGERLGAKITLADASPGLQVDVLLPKAPAA